MWGKHIYSVIKGCSKATVCYHYFVHTHIKDDLVASRVQSNKNVFKQKCTNSSAFIRKSIRLTPTQKVFEVYASIYYFILHIWFNTISIVIRAKNEKKKKQKTVSITSVKYVHGPEWCKWTVPVMHCNRHRLPSLSRVLHTLSKTTPETKRTEQTSTSDRHSISHKNK